MMDIVEIARDPKNLCQVQGCNTSPTCLCGLIEDMADEIERLREALKKVELRSGETHIVDLARSALQQKDSE